MSAALAAVRPDEWNLPLFLHVLGAMVLVGGAATASVAQVLGWRAGGPGDAFAYARSGFRALLLIAIPGWIVMRVTGQWIASEQGLDGDTAPAWIGVGFITAELGGLLLVVATILAGLGARRLGRGGGETSRLVRVSAVLVTITLVAYLVAVWAMTAKPV